MHRQSNPNSRAVDAVVWRRIDEAVSAIEQWIWSLVRVSGWKHTRKWAEVYGHIKSIMYNQSISTVIHSIIFWLRLQGDCCALHKARETDPHCFTAAVNIAETKAGIGTLDSKGGTSRHKRVIWDRLRQHFKNVLMRSTERRQQWRSLVVHWKYRFTIICLLLIATWRPSSLVALQCWSRWCHN